MLSVDIVNVTGNSVLTPYNKERDRKTEQRNICLQITV